MTSSTPADALFDMLRDCAKRRVRCPTTNELRHALCMRFGSSATAPATRLLGLLAKAGKIRVLIHGHNWRTVEILENGIMVAQTLSPPRPWAVYLVADRAGYHRVEA